MVLRPALTALLVVILAVGEALPSTLAAPGDLDPTFGEAGSTRADFGGSEGVQALAIQPDGRLVAAGSLTMNTVAQRMGSPPKQHSDFALARFDGDGRLDPTFGSEGRVVTDFEGGWDSAVALALQPDGKLVVAGSSGLRGTPLLSDPSEFVLARYTPDGALDPEFGAGGRVMTSFGGHNTATALAIQPDGKLAVAGTSWTERDRVYYSSVSLARYQPDGRPDREFGSDGRLTTAFGGSDARASDLLIQPDGKLVIGGAIWPTRAAHADFVLARLDPNGSPDPAFGTGGVVTTDFESHEELRALALQADGRLVAAGTMNRYPSRGVVRTYPVLARYTADGSLDSEFADAGRAVLESGGDEQVAGLALDSEGRLLVAGGDGQTAAGGLAKEFLLLRLLPDGALDDSFGGGGRVVGGLSTTSAGARALVIQPDRKPVLGGVAPGQGPISPSDYFGPPGDFILVRYLAT